MTILLPDQDMRRISLSARHLKHRLAVMAPASASRNLGRVPSCLLYREYGSPSCLGLNAGAQATVCAAHSPAPAGAKWGAIVGRHGAT